MNRRSFLKTIGIITGALIVNPIKHVKEILKPNWKWKHCKNDEWELKDWNGIEPGGMSWENGLLTIEGANMYKKESDTLYTLRHELPPLGSKHHHGWTEISL